MDSHPSPDDLTRHGLYLIVFGPFSSLVVRDQGIATQLADLLGAPSVPVASLDHAHAVLLALYGQLSTSTREVLETGADEDEEAPRPLGRVRVEDVHGNAVETVVSDPHVAQTLRDELLWP